MTYSFWAFEALANSLCKLSTDLSLLSSFTLNKAKPAGVSNNTNITIHQKNAKYLSDHKNIIYLHVVLLLFVFNLLLLLLCKYAHVQWAFDSRKFTSQGKTKTTGRNSNESDEYIITNTPEAKTSFPGCALLWNRFGTHFALMSELSRIKSIQHSHHLICSVFKRTVSGFLHSLVSLEINGFGALWSFYHFGAKIKKLLLFLN